MGSARFSARLPSPSLWSPPSSPLLRRPPRRPRHTTARPSPPLRPSLSIRFPSSHSLSASPPEWRLHSTAASTFSLCLRRPRCQAQRILSSTSSPQPNLILQTASPDQTFTRAPSKIHASAIPHPKTASPFSLARLAPCRVALSDLRCRSLTCESRTCTRSTTNQSSCRRRGERFNRWRGGLGWPRSCSSRECFVWNAYRCRRTRNEALLSCTRFRFSITGDDIRQWGTARNQIRSGLVTRGVDIDTKSNCKYTPLCLLHAYRCQMSNKTTVGSYNFITENKAPRSTHRRPHWLVYL